MAADGQTVKSVCRYQQYRAVNRAIHRLRTRPTRRQDGEQDRRGGIVWHTQGSGKSLTMVFLMRKLRTDALLRRFKVVVVTDRHDLHFDAQRNRGVVFTLIGALSEFGKIGIVAIDRDRESALALFRSTVQVLDTEAARD